MTGPISLPGGVPQSQVGGAVGGTLLARTGWGNPHLGQVTLGQVSPRVVRLLWFPAGGLFCCKRGVFEPAISLVRNQYAAAAFVTEKVFELSQIYSPLIFQIPWIN